MPGRLLSASTLALTLAVFAARPGVAAAQTPVPDAPTDGESPAPPVEPPATAPPPDVTAPGDFEPPPTPPDPPPQPPTEIAEPPPATPTEPDQFPPEPEPHPADPPPTKSPSPPPPTQTPTRTPPPPTPTPTPTPASAASTDTAAAPPASPPPADKPAHRESVRESTKRKTDADKRQRFRHGGFILDARVGMTGCMRTVCQSTSGHHAAPGLNLGGFLGFNLFGLIELGLEGSWNTLRPRGVAGRNAMALYGLDPTQLQQAITADSSLPIPTIDFSSLDVSSATSRAFDVGPSLRIHLIRKGRGLLFVGAGVHYQLWRNRYDTPAGAFRLDVHGASLPLRVGAGAFIHRNLALMAEVAYAPAIFGGMSFRLGDTRGLAPFKIIEDVTGIKVGRGLPHFWTVSLTLRFRL